ncbi:MAG: GDSL-type esterase/lipase family protein [Rhodanobacteraceae bacterium]
MLSRFLALGDSYTIGEGVPPGQGWPVQLVARLRDEGIEIGEPQIIATTGWTTDELWLAMEVADFIPPYALVTLLIGVNNQYRGRSLDEYHVQFRDLLQRATVLAGENPRHVIVVSIPDWGVTPFAAHGGRDVAQVAREIDAFNTVACAEVVHARAHWVDVTVISRATGSRDELVDDGLHPSGAQYARWVRAILPVAREILAGD